MARKYQLGSQISIGAPQDEWWSWQSANPEVIKNPNTTDLMTISPEEAEYHKSLSIGDINGNTTKAKGNFNAGVLAGGLQAASSMFGNINNMFGIKNSWADIISNSKNRRKELDAVNAQLEDYSGLNNVNDFFAAFGGYQPKSFAVGGHISGVKPLDDNNVAGSVGTAIASDAAQGAAIGTQIMPGWGTLIGAAVGTVSGATRGGIGAAQAKKNVGYLNNAIDRVNYMNDINRDNQISTIMNRNIRSTFPYGGNLFQYGGEIDPAMLQQLMAQQGQPQDFGDTGNGVTTFDEGGTHEMNPNGGIPQGVAPDGEENLVEEGEVKYKDYIYSDRLIATKQLLKEHNLPTKYAGKSFAKIADKLQEESKDRPNDEISKSTLNDMMTRLEEAQEEYKAQKEVEDKASQIDNMAPEEKAALLDQIQMMGQQQPAYGMQEPQGVDPMMAQQMMQPQDASMQQPQMSPEEQAMLEQQMAAEQGGQPYACGGRKYQEGSHIFINTRHPNNHNISQYGPVVEKETFSDAIGGNRLYESSRFEDGTKMQVMFNPNGMNDTVVGAYPMPTRHIDPDLFTLDNKYATYDSKGNPIWHQASQITKDKTSIKTNNGNSQVNHNYTVYQEGGNIPIGTRQAGGYSYAPFYDQYEAWLASQPVMQPQSIGYTYQPSATELELNATVNAIKENQAKQDFYNRWVGTGKDKKGKYWYYTNHPETKYYEEKPTLAEVDATVADMGYADTYAEGGDIYIKPSKRGTFTAAAKKHGKSVQAFASQVLANKENYSPAMVRKANFARNFGGHKHSIGGYLVGQTYDVSEEEYDRLKQLGYGIEVI